MLALYIHWPFCISKCPYCDFNSHVSAAVDHERWRSALLTELNHYAEQTQGRELQSIFFGGGTPSLMEPKTVQALIEEVHKLWPTASDLEITLEANPGTVDMERFKSFQQAGINRLSMGIQSLHDDQLQFLGRKHSAAEALTALQMARDIFPRYSFDLIYARPNQTLIAWEKELSHALTLAGDHLSLYQLTIEPGTSFYTRHNRGDFQIPQDDLAADLYTLTEQVMRAAGRPSYEVSNYAQPGQESRHNLMYWRYKDYIGVGPGAHGRLTRDGIKTATKGIRGPELWLQAVEAKGHGAAEKTVINSEQQVQERLMMGLRLTEGVPLNEIEESISLQKLAILEEGGFITMGGSNLKLTPEGRLCLNAVLVQLLR
jgi:putative oxygen-independent coproporphyrinogen III oxidase